MAMSIADAAFQGRTSMLSGTCADCSFAIIILSNRNIPA
ncbi:hypothetical protein Alg130_02316 [Pyrenophora tritici-repentis]|nr:hypothetical protein Alg130_02316 [Pyrenophora tritici-repentis]